MQAGAYRPMPVGFESRAGYDVLGMWEDAAVAPELSIVIPCYNEQECLNELHRRVSSVARGVTPSYELVLVNDGSRDATWLMMQQLATVDPHLVVVNLSRNHGQQRALTAGLDLSSGQRVLILDADLQDPPELLSEMMAVMDREEADVVYGVRRQRDGETAMKRATSALFYRILSRLSDVAIPLDTGDFRLMSRRAIDALLAMPEQARFMRGMMSWIGFRQVPFLYDRAPRHAGSTKFSFGKLLALAVDAMTGFSTAPLRLASHLGLALMLLSFMLGAYVLVAWMRGETLAGWPSLMLVIVSLGAIQLFVLGMIGEYLGRLYMEAKHRPLYIVSDVIGRSRPGSRLGHRADGSQPWAEPKAERIRVAG